MGEQREAVAKPVGKGGAGRRVARALFAPEFGRSLAPIRESVGAFALIWSAFRERLAMAKGRERRRRAGFGVAEIVVLALAVAAVGYGLVMLVGGGLLLLVPEAHGQVVGSGYFGGPDSRSRELLDFLFGIARGEGYGVEEMVRYFNFGVLIVVGALTIYHVLFAVVETGRSGEGKLSGWQMMRLVAGMGLVYPLPATGLGPAQHAVLELTDMGASLAAGVWTRFAGVIVEGGSGVPVRIPETYRGMLAEVVLLESCVYIHNEVAARAGDGPYIVERRRVRERPPSPARITYVYEDPDPHKRHWPCGVISMVTEPEVDNAGARMMALAHDAALTAPAMMTARQRAGRELGERYMTNTAATGEPLPDVNDWLDSTGIVAAYGEGLSSQVAAASEASRRTLSREVEEEIESRGWLGASAFFLVLSRNQAVFLDAVAALPEVDVTVGDGGFVGRLFDRVVEPWGEVSEELAAWLAGSAANESRGEVVPGVGGAGWWSGLTNWIPTDFVTMFEGSNPLEELVSLGHLMMSGGLAAVAAGTTVSSIPVVGTTVGKGIGAISTALGVLVLIGGIALAYVVPAMPFFRSLFGILAWVISVVEALVAIPLFLALQVGGEGHRLVSRASHGGYLLVLHAVVRPALMIFGLVFGYFVFLAVMELFNWLYVSHLQGLTNSTRMNVVTSVVALGMYVVIAVGVANAAFKCVDVIPQEVLHWLGSRVRGAADEAGGTSKAVEGLTSKLSVFRGLGRGG